MDIRDIAPGFSAAPQLLPDEMGDAAALGFRTVICNRPDGEVPGQPGVDEMKAAAEAAGMQFYNLPVYPGSFPPALIAEMRDTLDGAEGPILAYCRSGTRSTTLWALAQAGQMPVEEIVAAGARGGYDLSPLIGMLRG